MKHEVFILGGQRIDQKSRKGRRERIEKGSREMIIEKETKQQFEEKEGLRAQVGAQASKFGFYSL